MTSSIGFFGFTTTTSAVVLSLVSILGTLAVVTEEKIQDFEERGAFLNGYFTFYKDYRNCTVPLYCGGYYLVYLNVDYHRVGYNVPYIVKFLFDEDNIGFNRSLVTDASPKTVVIYGHYKVNEENDSLKDFMVIDAYVELPIIEDVVRRTDGRYYELDTHSRCFNEPCRPIRALTINSHIQTFVEIFSDPYINEVPQLDKKWYNSTLFNENVDLTGSVVQGRFNDDHPLYFIVHRVFVRTPDPLQVCPVISKLPECDDEEVLTYSRDSSRCLVDPSHRSQIPREKRLYEMVL
eukprot:gene12121-14182_t